MGKGIIARFMNLVPEPVSAVDVEQEIDENEYRKLAQRAGFFGVEQVLKQRAAVAKSHALRNFLAENGICVYPEDQVWRYMNSVTPSDQIWRWTWLGDYYKPIPEAVLMTMAKIQEAFPNDLVFEVTDIYAMPKGDPFLRVRISGTAESFIIERWDEPKFRS